MTPNEIAVQQLSSNLVMLDGSIKSLRIEALEFDDTLITIHIAPQFPHQRQWRRAILECRTIGLFDWGWDSSRYFAFADYSEGLAAILADGTVYLSFDPYDPRTRTPDHERDASVITCKSLKTTFA